jgi:hypothetical protein
VVVRTKSNRGGEPKLLAGEVQPVATAVEKRHRGALKRREDGDRQPDRTGAGDQNALSRLDPGAGNRMGADRQKFHHGRLVERKALGLQHEFFRQAQIFGHAAVAMHAEDAEVAAAIGPALEARMAVAAGDIGHDRDGIADRKRTAGRCFLDRRRRARDP